MNRVIAFGRFWWDFVVGDDWRIALGAAVALAATGVASHAHMPAWWIVPSAVVLVLTLSVWRAARRRPGSRRA
jgi:Flp pilus assembly protein TadB